MKDWKKRLPLALGMAVVGVLCAVLFSGPERPLPVRGLIAFGFAFGLFGGIALAVFGTGGLLPAAEVAGILILTTLAASPEADRAETGLYLGGALLCLALMLMPGSRQRGKKRGKSSGQKKALPPLSARGRRVRGWMGNVLNAAAALGIAGATLGVCGQGRAALALHLAAYGLAAAWFALRLTILKELLPLKPKNRYVSGPWGMKAETLLALGVTPGALQALQGPGALNWGAPAAILAGGVGGVCFLLTLAFSRGASGRGKDAAAVLLVSAGLALMSVTLLNYALPAEHEDFSALVSQHQVRTSRARIQYQIVCQAEDREWTLDVSKERYRQLSPGDSVVIREFSGRLWMKWRVVLPASSGLASEPEAGDSP